MDGFTISPIGTFGPGTPSGAEIVAFDPATDRLFVVNPDGRQINVLDVSDPTAPVKLDLLTIDVSGFFNDGVDDVGSPNSVAVSGGIVAVAVADGSDVANGKVAFFDTDGTLLGDVDVGAGPDMVTFTPDGTRVLVANEGEADGVDPEGSISIIDISGGVGSASVATAGFGAFNGTEDALRAEGVRIFAGKTVAEDVEPEYIAVSPDGATAFVTLQENNAVAVVDIATATVTDIQPLGTVDHDTAGNGIDASDADGGIDIANHPVLGMRQPDAIAAYEFNGETYYVVANEGDDRGEDERVGNLVNTVDDTLPALDPTAFPDAATVTLDENTGRLNVSTLDGDTDGDGDYDQLFSFGTRSFSIFDAEGNLVFDSGDEFEQIVAAELPESFNVDSDNDTIDNRSDNKGPEPEGITLGEIGGHTYAFIGLERNGGIAAYDVTNPENAHFEAFINNRDFTLPDGPGDQAPEGLAFISADDSPNGNPLLAVGFEDSGTTTLFEVSAPFTLQILHTADQEAGIPALDDAPRFSAVLNALADDEPNTLLLSSGDAVIPGVFFNASEDVFGAPGRADILIQNELGFQAIAFGNHEFDLGTGVVRDLILPDTDVAFGLAQVIEEAQQVTPVGDTASEGSLSAALFDGTLRISGSFDSLTSDLMPVGGEDAFGNPESAIHVHLGAPGTNGPIQGNLTVVDNGDGSGTFRGAFELSGVQATAALAGELYVNLHTVDNPGGELRGQITLSDTYEGTAFPYLGTNLDYATDDNVDDLAVADNGAPQANTVAGSVVIEVGGEQIGVIGATTPTLDTISSPGDVGISPVDFDSDDPADVAALAADIQAAVDNLPAGVNKVVLLAHMQQISIEQELAGHLTGVDVIMAGGSNTILADDTDRLRAGDEAADTYPILTAGADGAPVAIINTDGNYKYVGRLVVDFDGNGELIEESIDPNVSGAYATDDQGVADLGAEDLVDPEIAGITDLLRDVIIEQDSTFFGVTDVFLNGTRGDVRTQETNLGDLTADANLAIAKESDPATVISIKNGGGIRDNIGRIEVPPGGEEPEFLPPAGNELAGKPDGGISEIDISNTLRFNNGLTLLTLTAEELQAVIEHAVAQSGDGATPGRFPQVSGLQFSFDDDLPAGARVQSLAVVDENGEVLDIVVSDGELVGDPGREFRTVTLNFLAGGGDGYPFPDRDRVDLAQDEEAPRTGDAQFAPDGTEQDALAEYLDDNFSEAEPFDTADVGPENDERIQNLDARADTVLDGAADVTMGTGEADTITGTSADDTVLGNGGDDVIRGGAGDDFIDGGAGDDDLSGGQGADAMFGGRGNDTLAGDQGDDHLDGGDGIDRIDGGLGDDDIDGGAGDDTLEGGLGADTIDGGWGDDIIDGGLNDDTITGGEGDDIVDGGINDDVIAGGAGNDLLAGSHGNDTFVASAGMETDVITDFTVGEDLIDVSDFNIIDFGEILAAATDIGGDTLIEFDAENQDQVFLEGVAFEDLGAEDFVFADDTAIFDIQGAGHTSAFSGQTVITTGIVTALAFNGFYLQDAAGDGDIATSDGIFVFGFGAGVDIGDEVKVEGGVSEFFPGGAATGNLSTTQIAFDTITVNSSGNDLPDAVTIGDGGRLPPNQVVEDDNFGSFDPETDGIDFFESLEGMRVTVDSPVAVSATRTFSPFSSEVFTLPSNGAYIDPAEALNARGGIDLQPDPDNMGDQNPERVQIQFDATLFPGDVPAIAVGDHLGDVTGVVGYSFGNFEVNATEVFDVTSGGLAAETTDLAGAEDQLTVASYNVLNLSPGSSDDAQRETLAGHIVDNLGAPDIVALQEIQDNSGTTDDGTTAADQTLQALVDAIAAAGGPTYAFFDHAPADNTEGGVPGGNIRNAFLYNAERVTLEGFEALAPAVLDAAGVSDPDAFAGTRTPLSATFEFNGNGVTIVNNHLTSRFGSTPVYGAVQPFVQAGEAEREAQAQALNDFVDSVLAGDADANIVVLGDLNTFQFTNDLSEILPGTGPDRVLTNLIDTLDDDAVYTFNFEGNSQVLDHAFVTEGLAGNAELDIVHVNVDFPRVDSSVGSDHEPLLLRLTLENPTLAGGSGDDVLTGGSGDEEILGGGGDDTLIGGLGDDTIVGGEGNDTLIGDTGTDLEPDDSEANRLFGSGGDDRISGAGGDDHLFGEEDDDALFGLDGLDTLFGADGDDTLQGGAGDDVGYGDGGDDALSGGADDDRLFGGEGNDLVEGDGGNDMLQGQAGHDTMDGGDGGDTLLGGDGDDTLSGGSEGDTVFGDAGADTLNGDGGDDRLFGGTEGDWLFGDDGDDMLHGQDGADTLDGGAGTDKLMGGIGADSLIGGAGTDTLFGDGGDDRLSGGEDADRLFGGSGSDVLEGDAGDDRIEAGGDADTVSGGLGDDILAGDGGDDIFVFATASGRDVDRIRDFAVGSDALRLLGGVTITGSAESDLNFDGTADTTLTLSSGDEIELIGVNGLAGETSGLLE